MSALLHGGSFDLNKKRRTTRLREAVIWHQKQNQAAQFITLSSFVMNWFSMRDLNPVVPNCCTFRCYTDPFLSELEAMRISALTSLIWTG